MNFGQNANNYSILFAVSLAISPKLKLAKCVFFFVNSLNIMLAKFTCYTVFVYNQPPTHLGSHIVLDQQIPQSLGRGWSLLRRKRRYEVLYLLESVGVDSSHDIGLSLRRDV